MAVADLPEPRLVIRIDNKNPIELFDLTRSFQGLASEYQERLLTSGDPLAQRELRLYVHKIASGSIEAHLVALAPYALPFIENANSIIDFVKHLGFVFDHLVGKPEVQPVVLQKTTLENASAILEPIAKDHSSQINISTPISGDNNVITINFLQANTAQNRARKELEALREPSVGTKKKVLLYWYQTRNDAKSTAGDRAIIESISPFPVRTIFSSDLLKADMLEDTGNLFKYAYLVDVNVETVDGKPLLYKILEIHEKITR